LSIISANLSLSGEETGYGQPINKVKREAIMDMDIEAGVSINPNIPIAHQADNVFADTYQPLQPQELYQHDPLLLLQRDLLPANQAANMTLVVLGVLILTTGVIFGVEALNGTSFDLGPHLSYTIRALLQTLCFPAFAALYLLLPNGIVNLFNTLKKNGVIGACKQSNAQHDDYEMIFIPDFLYWIDNFWWPIAGVVILFWLYRLLLVQPQIALLKQSQTPLWAHITILLLYSPMLYCVFLCVVRLLVTLVFTNVLFHEYQIKVNPLSPDGYAGLGVLDNMLAISTGLLITIGIAALVMNSSFLLGNENPITRTEAVCLAIGYLALVPTLIFGWIILPHQVMLEARDEALQPLANEYEALLLKTRPRPDDDTNTITAGTDRLNALKARYDLVQSVYPIWPTTIQNVRNYTATLSLPVLIPIVLPLLGGLFAYFAHLFG
jgi:hypothetical protein